VGDSGIDCRPRNRPRPLPGKRDWNSMKNIRALSMGQMGSPGLDSGAFTGIKIVLEKLLAEYYGPSGILGAMD
jgi:hypothetical protein